MSGVACFPRFQLVLVLLIFFSFLTRLPPWTCTPGPPLGLWSQGPPWADQKKSLEKRCRHTLAQEYSKKKFIPAHTLLSAGIAEQMGGSSARVPRHPGKEGGAHLPAVSRLRPALPECLSRRRQWPSLRGGSRRRFAAAQQPFKTSKGAAGHPRRHAWCRLRRVDKCERQRERQEGDGREKESEREAERERREGGRFSPHPPHTPLVPFSIPPVTSLKSGLMNEPTLGVSLSH